MSINVYLKGEEVRELKDFVQKTEIEYCIPGVKLWYEKGRWYTRLNDLSEPVPPVLADIVEEISFHGKIPFYVSREAGIYRYNTAEAEVDLNKSSDDEWNEVRINAKKMEDLRELFRRIKIGSIRPEPGESYGGEQRGLSRVELDVELKRFREGTKAINYFIAKLCREKFPFCTKKWVVWRLRDLFYIDDNGKSWPKRRIVPLGIGSLMHEESEDRSLLHQKRSGAETE